MKDNVTELGVIDNAVFEYSLNCVDGNALVGGDTQNAANVLGYVQLKNGAESTSMFQCFPDQIVIEQREYLYALTFPNIRDQHTLNSYTWNEFTLSINIQSTLYWTQVWFPFNPR